VVVLEPFLVGFVARLQFFDCIPEIARVIHILEVGYFVGNYVL
jgi:hypothetical protein